MPVPSSAGLVYEFATFRLDVNARQLLSADRSVPLTPKAFDLLVTLVEHRDRLLDKDELMQRLWPDTVVEEANLAQNVFMLRKALGDNQDGQQFIATIPKRGYRFVAQVREISAPHAEMLRVPSPNVSRLLAGALAVLVVAVIAAGWFLSRVSGTGKSIQPPPVRLSVVLPRDITLDTRNGPALSHDGRQLAFVASGKDGRRLIWIRSLESATQRPLAGTESGEFPFWSPDGQSFGFFANSALKKTTISTSAPQTLCAVENGRGGAWNTDGTIVFGRIGAGLVRIPQSGGTPTRLTEPNASRHELEHLWPQFLPDERHLLYAVRRRSGSGSPQTMAGISSEIHVVSLDGTLDRTVLAGPVRAEYAADHVLFDTGYDDTDSSAILMAQRFDASRLALTGEAVQLADHIKKAPSTPNVLFSASPTGQISYASATAKTDIQLTWYDRSGRELGPIGEPGDRSPWFSPDGTRIAVQRTAADKVTIWILGTSQNTSSHLTFVGEDYSAVWSPDGARIVFSSSRDPAGLYMRAADGTGSDERLSNSTPGMRAFDWSPDGRLLVVGVEAPRTLSDLLLLPLSTGQQPQVFLRTGASEHMGRVSPNGRWMAYASDDTGDYEIFVQPFPSGSGKWQITQGGGAQPAWRRDGAELFYLAPDKRLMAVPVNSGGPTFQFGSPQPLFLTRVRERIVSDRNHYAVTSDGQRFIVNGEIQGSVPQTITVVLDAFSRR